MNKHAQHRIARTCIVPLLAGLAFAAHGQATHPATSSTPGAKSSGTVIRTEPVRTESMDKLMQAAQRLRESIQALANKPAGKDRDTAMQTAQKALLETQQAMVALPPEMRSWGTASTVSYDESVKKMMKAADALRESVQAMAKQQAGKDRDQAIRAANEALVETQSAMVAAYSATAPSSSSAQASTTSPASGSAKSSTMGAGTSGSNSTSSSHK